MAAIIASVILELQAGIGDLGYVHDRQLNHEMNDNHK
jgi:hypothetical protein